MYKPSKSFLKVSLFVSVCILVNLAILEFCIYYFVGKMKDKHSRNIEEMTIAAIHDDFKKFHDNKLGWNFQYDTTYGERPRSKDYANDFMAAFGDSFTFCEGVRDHETWEEYLSEILDANVYNFGVGAYGPDQAYLKFLEYLPKIKTKVVTLGLILENINRVVNTYRKFYAIVTGAPRTKPRFKLVKAHELYSSEYELVLIPNPIQDENELEKLTNVNDIHSIGKFDYFYQKNLFWKSIGFPYSKLVFSPAFLRKISDIFLERIEKLDLWRDKEARGIVFKIIDNFVLQAKKYNLVPIIMILPMREDVIYRMENNKNPPPADLIMKYCETHHYLCFNAITGLADEVKNSGVKVKRLIIGHPRPDGNRLIAKHFFNYLKQNDLLP